MTTRERILSVFKEASGISFKGADVLALQQPCVYLWLRKGQVLYVGFSRCGAERPLSPRHKKLHLQTEDELIVWPFRTVEEAETAERLLIAAFSPLRNTRRTYAPHLLKESLGVSYHQAAALCRDQVSHA